MTIDQRFAYLTKLARMNQGMTLQRFADDIRIVSNGKRKLNTSSASQIENGKRRVTLGLAKQISIVLGVPLSYLLFEDESKLEENEARIICEMVVRKANREESLSNIRNHHMKVSVVS